MKYKLDITNDVFKFLKDLPPKHFRQIQIAIYDLLKDPMPNDSASLSGYSELFRKDIGEYRIIYRLENETVKIPLIGKRNGNEVYEKLKRLLS